MKKIIILTVIVLLTAFLCSCTVTDLTKSTSDVSSTSSTSDGTSSTVAETTESVSPAIKELIDGNIFTINNITNFYLPHEEAPINEHYYKVNAEGFDTLSDLNAYLKNIYTKSAFSIIQSKIEGLYVDIDGQLCIDINKMGGKGYYVDWQDYIFSVDSVNEETCDFTVTGKLYEPGENVLPTPYIKNITAVKEDGKWLLNSEFY